MHQVLPFGASASYPGLLSTTGSRECMAQGRNSCEVPLHPSCDLEAPGSSLELFQTLQNCLPFCNKATSIKIKINEMFF